MANRQTLMKIVQQCMGQGNLTEWEGEFLDSLEIKLTAGEDLTAKQIAKLNEIDERSDK